jgi:hypothetical protein
MKLTVAVLVIASILVPTAWAADDHPALGDTLRAYVQGGRVEGTLVTVDGQALTLRGAREEAVVPLGSITRLDVRTRTSRGRHAGLGALVGGGLGFFIGFVATPENGCENGRDCQLLPATVLGVIGSGVGAQIGAALPTTHWRPIDTKGLHVSVAPVSRGAALRVSVSF